uniref:Uncharacterized protein n=1 Tax=Trichinella nativa TaxID=6335 RepID=A0A0V1K0W6_9BILA
MEGHMMFGGGSTHRTQQTVMASLHGWTYNASVISPAGPGGSC